MSVGLPPASRARVGQQHVSGTISVGGRHYGPECAIKMAEPGRAYLQVPDGKGLKKQKSIPFPSTYVFPPAKSWMKWACPVDGCNLEAQNVRGLARHWWNSHECIAFRDNGDGTLTGIGTCDVSMVVEQAPSVIAANAAAVPSRTRKRKTAPSRRPAPTKRTQRNRQTREDNEDDDDDEGEPYRQNGRNDDDDEPVENESEEEDQDGDQEDGQDEAAEANGPTPATPRSAWETCKDNFEHKYNALLAQDDPTTYYTEEIMDPYVSILTNRYGRNESVFVFPASFGKNRNDGQYAVPLSARHRDFLVFLIDHGTRWYGIFVDLRSRTRMVLAILDSSDYDRSIEAARIIRFLTIHNFLQPTQLHFILNIKPQHGLPREPGAGDEKGLFLLRGLACFLHDPATFFSCAEGRLPLKWAQGDMPTFTAAHTTHKDIIDTLKKELFAQAIDGHSQGFRELIEPAAANDPATRRILHHMNAARVCRDAAEADGVRAGAGHIPGEDNIVAERPPNVRATAPPELRVATVQEVPSSISIQDSSARHVKFSPECVEHESMFSSDPRPSSRIHNHEQTTPFLPFAQAAVAQMEDDDDLTYLGEKPCMARDDATDYDGAGDRTESFFTLR